MEEHDIQRTFDLLRRRIDALEQAVFGEGRGEDRSGFADKPDDPDQTVLEALRNKGTIQAIKVYRERTGAGLREAKAAVERLAEMHGA